MPLLLAILVMLEPSGAILRPLRDQRVIQRYAALLDPLRVGLELLAYVSVKLEKRGKMPVDQFTRAVQSWPEVITCFSMTGDMDYLMRVQVEDLQDHYGFLGRPIIMAQAGLYVPCSAFTYCPYTTIFTRILGNDNLFKFAFTVMVTVAGAELLEPSLAR